MTSQPGKQIIAIHILPNITRSKGNQTMKFDQLIKYITSEIFFFKNHAESKAGRLVPDLFLLFNKAFYEEKANGLHLNFNIFQFFNILPLGHTLKVNCIKL